ncbi:exodeoxyribonuclease V subunit gamma [Geomonas sp. Red32]|uniref:exodeoxyribonuclease V subunit gamma n=1 Tax=Geomonas sp. Red32 TaxID=2912856 RepID=UPI00202CCBCD|nr:exodeoxyribonuclease V subunit gamma [Geomonas sp. Red32]MCM0083530.1 exodeoxyribonuclease V subunit gamma [Geomonas sp. Red32]
MSLNIYTSNRLENLVEALAEVLRQPLASPFTPELLVVQRKGMQRWIAMELAGKLGIWANCEYPFPNKMAWQLFARTLPGIGDTSFFSAPIMTWKIVEMLPAFLHREEFAPLRHYLADDRDGLKRFQLASRVADTFDQYTFFRPEMLLEWEAGKGGDWQEILWRELSRFGGGQHRGRLKYEFSRLLQESSPGDPALPERITVFGVSYLPQYHLDILADAARHTTVNLFLLSPCREYWGDIVTPREMARLRADEQEYVTEGNPLLASLGKLARDFSNMVIDGGSAVVSETDLYRDPGDATLLAAVQSDILNLRGAGLEEKRIIAPEDRSLQIHSCHSPLREIEVLHDNLLDLLASDPTLECRDIVVMTPDIESYAPYVSMVFDGGSDPSKKIPFSIADRSLASEGAVAAVLLKLLTLAGSRLTATAVFDLLESPPVRARFGLDLQELELIRGWIEETRIRWGIDEQHRASLGLPAYRDNSWSAGLDRLLLGYAMPEDDDLLFNGVLPYGEIEGNSARTLGKFADFLRHVLDLSRTLTHPRALPEWRRELIRLLGDFVEAGDELAHELSAITKVVGSLDEGAEKAGFSGPVDLAVIRSWLTSRLGEEEQGTGFLTGSVTFCAMLPMRSIPFRVVALIGMDDKAFPRQSRPPGFDLIARHPRKGDRSVRDEDRYLFLECLMSAREYFYLSYVGQSIKDNSAIPPSVLVSELIDAVGKGFAVPEGKVEERLVIRHRLQAFSKSYFLPDSGLFSYSTENYAALVEAAGHAAPPSHFISAGLKEPPEEMRNVTLKQLVSFFANPSRFLLESRLGIRLEDLAVPLEEREAFAVDHLDAYGIKQQILARRLSRCDLEPLFAATRGRGMLPPARHGDLVLAKTVAEVDELAAAIETFIDGEEQLEPVRFESNLGPFLFSGQLAGIWPSCKVSYRCAKMKAKDEISCWIEHLVLNAMAPEGYPRESVLAMKDGAVRFKPVDGAVEMLASLLGCYWQGLKAPLRFFPASSLEYVSSGWDLSKALKKWESGYNYEGEQEDRHFQLCFGREETPLNCDFESCARQLLDPLIAHRETIK